jgi:hypothetical protein
VVDTDRRKPPGSVRPQSVLLVVGQMCHEQTVDRIPNLLVATNSDRSETKKSDCPERFDKVDAIEQDVPVVSAQAAWSDPRRLAD